MKGNNILVIDLFSGPGGLGEGFASFLNENNISPFKIGMSVEKDQNAHKTLTTRAFYRIAKKSNSLEGYYQYLEGKISREELFETYKSISEAANYETLNAPRELGKDNQLIHERVRELINKHTGPKILIGGPPCQAYSLAGRSRNAGNKNYVPENDHRHFLYKEYLQVLSIAQPDIFVMENVRGILTAKIEDKLIFPQILNDLRNPSKITKGAEHCPSYKIYSLVEKTNENSENNCSEKINYLIKSEEFGIPQARHRVILLGIREDIKQIPDILNKDNYPKVSVKEAIGDLPKLRSGLSKKIDSESSWKEVILNNIEILNKLNNINFKDKDLYPYKNLKRKEKIHKNKHKNQLPKHLCDWILDSQLNNLVLNHETRGHMESDLLRYSFCALYGQKKGVSPKSEDFPHELAPQHQNWNTGTHNDRFRVQISSKVATTITSHISKDGHYFIHYDPKQCRSLTVRESARLQTFPDNYIFEGNRTNQYIQVGNAVPPYLALQISSIVYSLLKKHYINL
ncbi:TPA: DNA cytosine methyltransferase [Acinetobacter baumannii]|uniref:DNA cytosine methyltransferase n=1 Tax=Acinetobacter baumannii TaxID=470 RepID=UPI0007EE2F57|nr:DNA (cytosine-5-)-methyltransferase [Acinetobacter baumannii]MBK4747605.1 Modification methylase BspRI [Acinetobacter baumannii]MDC5119698.1 DNA (cytosine-5-)-methyltransferase [Acinetobacter baumannii]MDV7491102.1 DNA (cytosine-5-)-methyltransferase [Acinetobacter baumannii]OBS05671.1 DNA (cytosine-5-)-methyltransferase [Acinetobacter baumannii]OOD18931.1 DNA (cytosine-5-)-methyltransferase [Acinetobacter baumannii]